MKKLTCLFTLILLAGITFTGKTQNAPDTNISDFKLSIRIMIDETDPLALRVKGYLIEAFREVPDLSIVKSDEDVVLQVSVNEITGSVVVNGIEDTLSGYILAVTHHMQIPSALIEILDKLIEASDKGIGERVTTGLLTFEDSIIPLTPVWVEEKSIPLSFCVIPKSEAKLERMCARVVSHVNTLLPTKRAFLREIRNMTTEVEEKR